MGQRNMKVNAKPIITAKSPVHTGGCPAHHHSICGKKCICIGKACRGQLCDMEAWYPVLTLPLCSSEESVSCAIAVWALDFPLSSESGIVSLGDGVRAWLPVYAVTLAGMWSYLVELLLTVGLSHSSFFRLVSNWSCRRWRIFSLVKSFFCGPTGKTVGSQSNGYHLPSHACSSLTPRFLYVRDLVVFQEHPYASGGV